jgi:hypothetical protein
VAPDRAFDVAEFAGHVLGDRLVDPDCGGEAAVVHEAVAVRARHARVDLRDHHVRRVDRRARDVDRDAERAVAVLVGRRHVHQRHVERQHLLPEEGRHLAEEGRHVVGIAAFDRVAHVGTDEQRVHVEALGHAGLHARVLAFGVQVHEFDRAARRRRAASARSRVRGVAAPAWTKTR